MKDQEMKSDVDFWLDSLTKGNILSVSDMKHLCEKVRLPSMTTLRLPNYSWTKITQFTRSRPLLLLETFMGSSTTCWRSSGSMMKTRSFSSW